MSKRPLGTGRRPVTAEQLLHYVQQHPDCQARELAVHFYKRATAALSVGQRLQALVRVGFLTARYDDGWRYRSVKE